METRVKLLGSTALAAAAFVMAAPSASAQDGDALEKRVQALEKAGGMYVTRKKKTMKLVISGHINRHITYRDDGTKSGITHNTSNYSRTRVRWIGTGKISDDVKVQTYIELGNQESISTAQDLNDNGDSDGAAVLDSRFVDMRITSKSLGKISIGQGSGAGDGIAHQDLSSTGLISLNGNFLIGGSEVFQTAAGASTGITVGGVFTNLNPGRHDRIRYDTPKFAGFNVAVSHGNADRWEAALYYGGSMGGVKVKAAIGYSDRETQNGQSVVVGSASVLLPMGLSVTVGAGDRDSDRAAGTDIGDSTDWRYAKVGYKFKGSELGQTRLYMDWSNNNEVETAGDDATSWGVGMVQVIEPLGAELQIGYRNFELDRVLADPEDVNYVTVGLRVSF